MTRERGHTSRCTGFAREPAVSRPRSDPRAVDVAARIGRVYAVTVALTPVAADARSAPVSRSLGSASPADMPIAPAPPAAHRLCAIRPVANAGNALRLVAWA